MNHLTTKLVFHSFFWIFIICLNSNLLAQSQVFFNLESGALFTEMNDIRSGKDGTVFSLKNDFKTPVSPYLRLRVGYLLNEKDFFSVLYAPLKIEVTETLKKNILFDGKNFRANIPTEVVYMFNSYRFTYNRRIVNQDKIKFGLGFSAKIREAGFTLKNREFSSGNFTTGFVPLINILLNWDISQKFGIDFFGEGFVASQGRAIDLSLSGRYNFTKNFQGNIGYRLLEGGSDGVNKYNFIKLHFLLASLSYTFDTNKKAP